MRFKNNYAFKYSSRQSMLCIVVVIYNWNVSVKSILVVSLLIILMLLMFYIVLIFQLVYTFCAAQFLVW